MFVIDSIITDESSKEVLVVCSGQRYKITLHDYLSLCIDEGDCLDEDKMSELEDACERLSCIKKAFDYLSYGDLSQRQLRDKLARKFSKELASDVVDLFVERGYVNDERLAIRYAETFYEFKNMGLQKIRNELFRRGIAREYIDNALEKYECKDQSERIKRFIEKKYDVSQLNDVKYRRKVYSGAVRAGFGSSDVADFLRNFESEKEYVD